MTFYDKIDFSYFTTTLKILKFHQILKQLIYNLVKSFKKMYSLFSVPNIEFWNYWKISFIKVLKFYKIIEY